MSSADSPRFARAALCAADGWLIFLIVFGYGYFYNAHNWNHISRFDAIFSFVEPDTPDHATLQIDHFLVSPMLGRNTGDWARNREHGPHYYSNKAPGVSLLGIPVYGFLYFAESTFGATPESQAWTRINTYLLNWMLSVLPIALASVLLSRLARGRLGLTRREATTLALIFAFGTLIFPYATQLWGHVTATAFLVASLYFFFREGRTSAAWSGCFAGLAVLSEYSAAIPLVGMMLLLAYERRAKRMLTFALGGMPAFCVHWIYHKSVFGSGFAVANVFNNPKFHDVDKLGGIFGGVESDALFGLSFSLHHGLFSFMPILLLVIPALGLAMRGERPEEQGVESEGLSGGLLFLCLFTIAGFIFMNLSFNGWHGGFCLGPRYLIPSLPYWVLLGVPVIVWLRSRGALARGVVAVLAVISIANMSLLAMRAPSTTFVENNEANPLLRYYEEFATGALGEQRLAPLRLDGDWTIADQIVSQRNGFLDLAADGVDGSGVHAESFIRMKKAGRIGLLMGWRGDLVLRVNGERIETPHQEAFVQEMLSVHLSAGENEISVAMPASDTPRFSFLALAPAARPQLPRAYRDAPEHSLSGANLGTRLGLVGVASVVPWILGMSLIGAGLVRSFGRSNDGV